jgi:hypothetical protein
VKCGKNDLNSEFQDWILHDDNASAHSALPVCEFLATKKINVIPHSPYSPDAALKYFLSPPKIHNDIKGKMSF